jgi:cation transport regulator ChaC
MYYYFAYGSNLDRDQMSSRCPKARPADVAYLDGFQIAFGGHSPRWEGPPATIIEKPDATVPGLLYEISWRELEILDNYEGHPDRYVRHEMEVVDRYGNMEVAQVYIKTIEPPGLVPPADYLAVIRQAYRQLGFDLDPLEAAVERAHDSS